MHRLVRSLWIMGGTIAVALGAVGIVVPVLPTTPFMLLAAYCYARSSRRFLHWLLHNRWFGCYIRNYRERRGMSLRHKILTLVALWLSIAYAVLYAVAAWWGKALLVAVALGVTAHLWHIRTLKPDPR